VTFFIGADCLDVRDRSCVDECPVDCIYEGSRKLYIQPSECIDCGACEVACPVNAIATDLRMSDEQRMWYDDNAAFFAKPLPDRAAPLGSLGGATGVGPVGVDTPLASAWAISAGQDR
jgi:NAD-dependent dihydropyrimidine dehydrogenase PreA subunit